MVPGVSGDPSRDPAPRGGHGASGRPLLDLWIFSELAWTYNNGQCVRELQALVAPKTPPVFGHAGLVINKLSHPCGVPQGGERTWSGRAAHARAGVAGMPRGVHLGDGSPPRRGPLMSAWDQLSMEGRMSVSCPRTRLGRGVDPTRPCWRDLSPFGSLRSPPRALPTETKVESGTSQSKSGTSVNFSNSGNSGAAQRDATTARVRSRSCGTRER